MHAKLLQSCLILCDPVAHSPPGSSAPGILQARILDRMKGFIWGTPVSSGEPLIFLRVGSELGASGVSLGLQ